MIYCTKFFKIIMLNLLWTTTWRIPNRVSRGEGEAAEGGGGRRCCSFQKVKLYFYFYFFLKIAIF